MTTRVLHVCTTRDFVCFMTPVLGALQDAGYEIHVCCSGAPQHDTSLGIPAANVHRATIERGMAPLSDLRGLGQLVSLMRRLKPQIVHAHTPKGGLLGMLAARIAGVPVPIYHMHGLRYETASGHKRVLLENAERTSCSLARTVICISSSVRKKAIFDGILSEAKAVVLARGSASGIDPQTYRGGVVEGSGSALRRQLGLDEDQLVVGFAGRLAKDKGLGVLAEAWEIVEKVQPRAHLLLAGEPDETDPVDLSALQDRPSVHFLGRLPDLRGFYGSCDVVTLPSFREGLPQVLLESAALGLPSVATEVTGIVDVVVSGETGLLVEKGDARALSRALLTMLSSGELRTRLGESARRYVVENFSQREMTAAVISLYGVLSSAQRHASLSSARRQT